MELNCVPDHFPSRRGQCLPFLCNVDFIVTSQFVSLCATPKVPHCWQMPGRFKHGTSTDCLNPTLMPGHLSSSHHCRPACRQYRPGGTLLWSSTWEVFDGGR